MKGKWNHVSFETAVAIVFFWGSGFFASIYKAGLEANKPEWSALFMAIVFFIVGLQGILFNWRM